MIKLYWPDDPPVGADAMEHAAAILTALEGDYRAALENMPVFVMQYGLDYALRLEYCLTPHGEA